MRSIASGDSAHDPRSSRRFPGVACRVAPVPPRRDARRIPRRRCIVRQPFAGNGHESSSTAHDSAEERTFHAFASTEEPTPALRMAWIQRLRMSAVANSTTGMWPIA
jgi:hypothetical protein